MVPVGWGEVQAERRMVRRSESVSVGCVTGGLRSVVERIVAE
jgi:hypothetical protein